MMSYFTGSQGPYERRGRAKTKFSTGLEGQLYLEVTGPPPKSLGLIFMIKMQI